MELSRLEKYKNQFKELEPKISYLQSYLENASREVHGIALITPYEVSSQSGMDEMSALFVLSLAAKEHLVSKRYAVFAEDDNTLIGEFPNKSEIPERINNPETGKDIDSEHYYVEISFEVAK